MRRSRRNTVRPETLETRLLLSAVSGEVVNGVLTVTGSEQDDVFSLAPVGNEMVLDCDGDETRFPLDEIRSVVIRTAGGNDNINYSGDAAAVIEAGDGNDTVLAGNGNDEIDGGDGDDSLKGRSGRDTIVGGSGNDTLIGGRGSDEMYGYSSDKSESGADDGFFVAGSGADKVFVQSSVGTEVKAGGGSDTVTGGSGNDTILGGNGADNLSGAGGNDSIQGNNANDTLVGGSGNDTLSGNDGDDFIQGSGGKDKVVGGADNDAMDGGSGDDQVSGGSGSDIAAGGSGEDTVTGGSGDNVLVSESVNGLKNVHADLIAEWASSRTYTERVRNLTDGSGSNASANNGQYLTTDDDPSADELKGSSSGSDWFFGNTSTDTITGLTDGEQLDQLGTCEPSSEENGIAELAQDDSRQGRASMTCHLTLSEVARARALDMATRDYASHTNPDGDGPNKLAREAGYVLPSFYSTAQDANNIESIAFGYETYQEAFDAWMGSTGHRTHLLGLSDFNAAQIEYGVGYAYNANSTYGHYWVFLSAYRE